MADGINYQTPTVTSLDIKVYGDVNNISVAAAIYNWFKVVGKTHKNIDLTTVATMLKDQAMHDARAIFVDSLKPDEGCREEE